MHFLKDPVTTESQNTIIQWMVQPERQKLNRLVEALIAFHQVAAANIGTAAEKSAFDGVLNPQLNDSQREHLSKAAEWRLFLEKFEEIGDRLKKSELFTGRIEY